jgi:hypothetical protein
MSDGMPSHVVLVLWVVASDVASPTTTGASAAVRDVLGEDRTVQVRTLDESGAMQAAGHRLPAGASVARLTWSDTEHRHAHLTCYLPRSQRWVSRDVVFTAEDPETERGRTLGFLVASMLLDEGGAPKPRMRAASAPAPGGEYVQATTMAMSAAASAAFSGDVTGLGAWMSAEYLLVPRIGVGVAGDLRFGSIPALQATTQTASLTATSSLELYRPTQATWLGVRAAAGAMRIAVSRLSEDDPTPETHARWAPLVEVAGRAAFGFVRHAGVFAELGLDTTLTRRTVPVEDSGPARFPVLFPVVRLGVGASF